MSQQLVDILKKSELNDSKAMFVLQTFQDYFKVAAEWELKAKSIKVTDENQTADMKMARIGRLELRSKRIEIEKKRKELKEQSLREGRAIDGVANVLKGLIEPLEEYLNSQEKFVEIREAKRKEEERLEAERLAEQKRIEEEEAQEKARIAREKAEREERERILKENEKVKQEAAEAERKHRLEAERMRKEQEEKDRKAKKELEEAERKRKKEAEKLEKAKKLALEKAKEANKKVRKAESMVRVMEKKLVRMKVCCPQCNHRFDLEVKN